MSNPVSVGDDLVERLAKAEAALTKIDAIRNSIIGFQNVGWSDHIYPLVAALEEAGYSGAGYDKMRTEIRTMLAAEARATTAEAHLKAAREALMVAEEALATAEDRDQKARFRANSPRMDAEVIHLRTTALRAARAALNPKAPS